MNEHAPLPETTPEGCASIPLECTTTIVGDRDLVSKLEKYSMEAIIEHKISRFLDQIGSFYPDALYDLMLRKIERPLITQILHRTGGNQVQAAKVLGINRNTLRTKMKLYGIFR